jgi:nucleoprotein TPR
MKEDLRRQVEMTSNAQRNYQRELVAHADDVQILSELREKYNELNDKIASFQAQATTAEAKLTSAQASWAEQRALLERNIKELENRCAELTVQNNNLRSYLDSAAASIRRISGSETETKSSENATITQDAAQKLQVVNQDLRNETIRLRSQLDLKESETRRLTLQLNQTERQLAECRSLLMEERRRQDEMLKTEAQHNELMEKVNQLNILRESNAALRADNERARQRITQLEAALAEVENQLEPLRLRNNELSADIEARDMEIRLLKEDNQHWKDRTQQILQTYKRIDPYEHDKLQEEKTRLETELTELTAKCTELETQLATHKETSETQGRRIAQLTQYINQWKNRYQELSQKSQERLQSLQEQLREAQQQQQAAQQQAANTQQQVSEHT